MIALGWNIKRSAFKQSHGLPRDFSCIEIETHVSHDDTLGYPNRVAWYACKRLEACRIHRHAIVCDS